MLADADSTYGEQEGSALTVIRLASPSTDAGAVAAIYRAAVESSVASFETDPPDASTMAGRMQRTLERTPWLVAVEGSPPIPDHWVACGFDLVD